MKKLKLIAEYRKVKKFYLAFAQQFYNTRFAYGKVIAKLINILHKELEVIVMINPGDEEYLLEELKEYRLYLSCITIDHNYFGTAIVTTGFPILAEDQTGKRYGLTYQSYSAEVSALGSYICRKENLEEIKLKFRFNSAAITTNNNLALISTDELHILDKINNTINNPEINHQIEYFKDLLDHELLFVPSLPGDTTCDLDTYLLPIKPKVWISSAYQPGSLQCKVIEPVIEELEGKGHLVHRVPGLEQLCYSDINTLPNYPNSVIVNDLAFVPAYGRAEDKAIQAILKEYAFKVFPVDCRKLVESNAVLHCLSRMIY